MFRAAEDKHAVAVIDGLLCHPADQVGIVLWPVLGDGEGALMTQAGFQQVVPHPLASPFPLHP